MNTKIIQALMKQLNAPIVDVFAKEMEFLMMDKLLTRLIIALIAVESGGDPSAIGDNGKAVGVLQIHKICVDDVNRIYGTDFTYDDRYNREKSIRMCELYLRYYGTHYEKKTRQKANMEVLAAMWCSGPQGYRKMNKPGVKRYIEKVRKELEK